MPLNWADLKLPPINLWSMPRQDKKMKLKIPHWNPNFEFSDSAIERFIFEYEPSGMAQREEFREKFNQALEEARSYSDKAWLNK